MKVNGLYVSFLINLASLPLIFYYILRKGSVIRVFNNIDAIFFADGKPDNIIPDDLRNEFDNIITIKNKGEYLSREDKAFMLKLLKRYPCSWHFLLKCLIKIRNYSYEIQRLHPKAIIVCNEYSFTSSILTYYCKIHGIKHINIMHGEKLYFIRDSFFRFDRCYVWNEQYRNLFCELRAEISQIKISVPPSLIFKDQNNIKKQYDFTYYLGAEKGIVLENIIKALQSLAKRGNRVSIRPHPRYSDLKEIQKLCGEGIIIEDGQNISIEESVLKTLNAVSGYSTVLNQAYHNGVSIVIDDISNPNSYKKLKELGYVMLNVKHKLFSEILK